MPSREQYDPQSLDEMFDHVRVELRRRLLSGEECRLEEYFDSYPDLARDPARAIDLIRVEWSTRRDMGHKSTLQDWVARFPQWEYDLRSSLDAEATGEVSVSSQATTKAGGGGTQSPRITEGQPEIPSPVSLDHHEILEFLGEGGMGVVHRAWDPVLKRHVALKRIKSGALAGPREVERFYREAQAAARLRHPNIVEIHGMGLFQGQHCFTMNLLTGGTLAAQMEQYRSPRLAVSLVDKVARAVHVAHQQGVIHRDLKPGNVFLDAKGEPLVGDFGLAKLMEPDVELSHPGILIGTPAYMAPEQFLGDSEKVTAQSDLWALGVILYELLTGRRPFQAKTWHDFSREVNESTPPRPMTLEPCLDHDLDAIILRCLAKSPAERFASAEELADALRDWLQGKRSPTPRKRGIVPLAVLLTLVVVGLVIVLNRGAKERAIPEHLNHPPTILLGESGEPLHAGIWRVGEPFSSKALRESDKVFTLKTSEIALYELVSRPEWEHYRIDLDVRQTAPLSGGEFGVYFAHETAAGMGGDWHTYLAASVKGNSTAKLHVATVQANNRLPVKNGRQQTEVTKTREGKGNEGWHRLTVDVGPVDVRVSWDGEAIGVLARAKLEAYSRDNFAGFVPVATCLNWGGGLGLYAVNGTASFRNVTIREQPRP